MSEQALAEAYVLHARKYRDTSLIVELLTREEGRVSAVIRGVRTKNSRLAGQIRPFRRFLVSWFGRSDLKTVKATDFPFSSIELRGNSLLLGLYVNELLVRLAGKYDPMPEVFDEYGHLLLALMAGNEDTAALRRFELCLLRELGYGITFEWDAGSGQPVAPGNWYRYVPDEGFHEVREPVQEGYYKGEHLIAINEGRLAEPGVETSAKRIIRMSLASLLGDRPLKSREMFGKREESR